MRVIKLGDRSAEVKKLQKLLHLLDDGIFGKLTQEAVKKWQKEHNLIADGIVGQKTWDSLGIKDEEKSTNSTNPKCVDQSVIYSPLTCCITKLANRTIKYLAIHYTAGGSSAPGRAIGMKSTWEKTKKASADFGVDDRDMVQFNPDPKNYYCWSVGDKKNPYSGGGQLYGTAKNSNTISIEICSSLKSGYGAADANHEGWYFTEAALANGVKLAKILMKKYNIPIERVVRHYDISGKVCPGIVGWNNSAIYSKEGKATKNKSNSDKWKEFKERLKN